MPCPPSSSQCSSDEFGDVCFPDEVFEKLELGITSSRRTSSDNKNEFDAVCLPDEVLVNQLLVLESNSNIQSITNTAEEDKPIIVNNNDSNENTTKQPSSCSISGSIMSDSPPQEDNNMDEVSLTLTLETCNIMFSRVESCSTTGGDIDDNTRRSVKENLTNHFLRCEEGIDESYDDDKQQVADISDGLRSLQISNVSKQSSTEMRELLVAPKSDDDGASSVVSNNRRSSNRIKSTAFSVDDNIAATVAISNYPVTTSPSPPPPSALWNIQTTSISGPRIPLHDTFETYVLRFDGGSRGNPGLAGAGMVLYRSTAAKTNTSVAAVVAEQQQQQEIWHGYHFIGSAHSITNNEAEYTGLILGMRCAAQLGVRHIWVQGDSNLVVQQVNGKWRCKNENLRAYWKEALKLREGPAFQSFTLEHIARSANKRADELANLAMDQRTTKL